MIIDVTLAHVIAAEHELAGAPVPDREGKIAKQMFGASLAPFSISLQHQRTVRHVAQLGRADAEDAGELLAIVDPQIGDEKEIGAAVDNRLALEQVFLIDPQQAMAEPGRAGDDGLDAIGSAMTERVAHALKIARGDRAAVKSQDAENRAHGCVLSAPAARTPIAI